MVDLWTEMFAAARNLQPRDFQALGIDTDLAIAAGGLGIQTISGGDTFFETNPSGDPAYIVPVYWNEIPAEGCPVPNDDLIDLAAFRLDDPSKIWLRTGLGEFLNATALDGLYLDAPLRVHRSVQRWMQEGAEGCVPLNSSTAALRLRSVPLIVADDEDHAIGLERMMRLPAIVPTIRFLDPALADAAA